MSSKKIQYIALYFSRINIKDPKNDNKLRNVATSGSIAGLYARTDAARGVWKAPVGKNAVLIGVEKLDYFLTNSENDDLNSLAINC